MNGEKKFQVYGNFGGEPVLLGWPRKSLRAAFSFAHRLDVRGVYSDIRVVHDKGRTWRMSDKEQK